MEQAGLDYMVQLGRSVCNGRGRFTSATAPPTHTHTTPPPPRGGRNAACKDRRCSVHFLCWDIRELKAAGDHAALMHDTTITPYRDVCVCGALIRVLPFTRRLTVVFIWSIPHVLPATLPLRRRLVPVSVAKFTLALQQAS